MVDMEIRAKFTEGVFKPLEEVTTLAEGEIVELHLERTDWQALAMSNPSFGFLKEEPGLYSEEDIKPA